MKRPKAHRTGDIAESKVRVMFESAGWVVQRFEKDYGFDFMLQCCEDDNVSFDPAFLQVKGTENLLQKKDHSYSFNIDFKHLQLWCHTEIPSYLCVVELPTEKAFLSNTRYLLSKLAQLHGSDFLVKEKGQSKTICLLEDMLIRGNRLSNMDAAIKKRWEEFRVAAMPFEGISLDIAPNTRQSVKWDLEKAFTPGQAKKFFMELFIMCKI